MSTQAAYSDWRDPGDEDADVDPEMLAELEVEEDTECRHCGTELRDDQYVYCSELCALTARSE